jgi:hypothetical protein
MSARHVLTASTLATLLLLAGCAIRAPEPGTVVAPDRFSQLVVPGHTTRAELLAAFGPTKNVRFDSGMETWLYEADAGAGRHAELVVLLDRDGVVRKTRTRPPYPSDAAQQQR